MDPGHVGICHCRDCQIFSGSAFRTVGAVAPANFRFTKGHPVYFDKVGDLGGTRRMAFCGECGTHICALPADNSAFPFISLRTSTADQFEQLVPVVEGFCASKVSWLPALEGMQQYQKQVEN
ncbi:GFA family protein [Qipengyuania xiamenensis]|uniref:GFA family protein n=1 Tax=Qipengyuania xiamenensis TaxID=2867237 RepID=UPI003CD0D61A